MVTHPHPRRRTAAAAAAAAATLAVGSAAWACTANTAQGTTSIGACTNSTSGALCVGTTAAAPLSVLLVDANGAKATTDYYLAITSPFALTTVHGLLDDRPAWDHGCRGVTDPVDTNNTPAGSQLMSTTVYTSNASGNISGASGTIPLTTPPGPAYICFLSTDYNTGTVPFPTVNGVVGPTDSTKPALFTVL